MDYKKLQNGSDIRGVALEGIEGQHVNLTEEVCKNIGRGFIEKVTQERRSGGPFRSLEDFCGRMHGTELNKRAMENLIKCGACDCFGLKRSQMLFIYEAVMDSIADSRRRNVEGQIDLFGMGAESEEIAVSIPVPDLQAYFICKNNIIS